MREYYAFDGRCMPLIERASAGDGLKNLDVLECKEWIETAVVM